MKVLNRVVPLVCLLLGACGGGSSEPPSMQAEPTDAESAAATCTPVWSPTWSQGTGANTWWVEYTITGGVVQSAYLEVVGGGQVPLSFQYSKWVGGPSVQIPSGTKVIVHATNNLGQTAKTTSFAYLQVKKPTTNPCGGTTCVPSCTGLACGSDGCGGSCGSCATGQTCTNGACVASCTPSCTGKTCGSDGCGGSCGSCATGQSCSNGSCVSTACVPTWNPVWQQESANNWWVEFAISKGTVTSAYLEVVGGGQVALTLQSDKWAGGSSFAINNGTSVILHAADNMGHTAQTVPFQYLVNTSPSTDPCKTTGPANTCGDLAAGMLTITMDDSFEAQYTLARQKLLAHNMKASLMLVTAAIDQSWSNYMSLQEAQAMVADGNEICSHTVDHPDLTTLTASQVDGELKNSQLWIQQKLGVLPTQFAAPYGAYNDTVVADAKLYYQSLRTATPGLAFRGDDPYSLKGNVIFANAAPSDVAAMIQQAKTDNGWLILVFHNFTTGTPGDDYTYAVANFSAVLDAIAASGIQMVTLAQGVSLIHCAQ